MLVQDVVVKLTVDRTQHPEIVETLWGDEWPDWLLGVEIVCNGAARETTNEENESIGCCDDETGEVDSE